VGPTAAYLSAAALQLDASNSPDPSAACAGPLSYNWSVFAKPPGSNSGVFPAHAAKPVFSPDTVGDYVFQLIVSDDRLTSVPSYLHIVVQNPLQDVVASGSAVLWNDSAVDPATGNPTIAFYQLNNNTNLYDLIFMRCTANCASSSETWVTQTVDTGLLDPSDSLGGSSEVSLRYLSTGAPALAYHDTVNCLTN
jgi:hypothetical protein